MAWKFWKSWVRGEERRQSVREAASAAEEKTAALNFPLFPNSNREVIALQRLVGNQVVLQLLERRRLAGLASRSRFAATSETPRRWWHATSRREGERS